MFKRKTTPLRGSISIPGDKSISHRAIMLGALADGITEISNFLQGEDCLSTISCFQQMGISIDNNICIGGITVHGKGLLGLSEPKEVLDVGNSGTTMRLLSGILCGQSFPVAITGDSSIRKRPMGRILTPLQQMGANIISQAGNGCAPLLINNSEEALVESGLDHKATAKMHGIHYLSPVASAQVKSCVLLAGLYAEGESSVTEPFLSRNHTELMLKEFGATIKTCGNTATIVPGSKLTGRQIKVPGDISSAAYFIAAALLVPNSELLIKNVGINSTRDGIIKICQQMGANISLQNINTQGGEPVADILVCHSNLRGVEISGGIIPTLIDEIPIIAILACYAEGQTVIKDASELKVKESNRIDIMVQNLTRMGADILATEDGMIINGGKPLHGAVIETKSDHRIAMSFAVAGLLSESEIQIENPECVDISYPGFYHDLKKLQA